MKKKEVRPFEVDDRVKLIIDEDQGPVDLGMSGIVLHSSDARFGPYINSVMYYMGELKDMPHWCVISTSKNVTSSTRHYMVLKDSIKHED